MSTYEKLPMFTKRGTIRLIKGLATDPLTYLGVGTLGATVAKGLSKQALKSRLKSFIGPQALLIYEGMGYGAFDDYSRQQIAINANQQEGVDPVRLGTSTAIGGAGAAVLGEAGKQVGKVAKKVFSKKKNNEGIAEVQAPTENQPGIIAFHGSGADFDRFRLDKIGTGEGAQAFGYGLYFTDSEDIAKFYRNSLGGANVLKTEQGINIIPPSGKEKIKANFSGFRNKFSKLYGDDEALFADRYLGQFSIDPDASEEVLLNKTIETMKSLREKIPSNTLNILKKFNIPDKGKMYKVALAPKPDELLDYDKTITEQSQKIQDALFGNEKIALFLNKRQKEDGLVPDFYVSSQFYDDLSNIMGDDANVSKLLSDVGIKGIKYKAGQLSGVKDSEATNYVIFDENLINILAKYGIVGSVGITAIGDDDGS